MNYKTKSQIRDEAKAAVEFAVEMGREYESTEVPAATYNDLIIYVEDFIDGWVFESDEDSSDFWTAVASEIATQAPDAEV